ncbi:MAG: hypothetical protein K9K64_08130 [Desulfohalobiaceae bacterium]|nr:hypothetical protein [Desulfohalobiaceae bacterium]
MKIRYREILLQLVLFGSALALTVERFFRLRQEGGLCTTSSCQVVGEQLRIAEIYLIMAGAFFFWLMWLLVFFAGRYQRTWLWNMALIGLFAALAFDGGLLGYQFVGLELACLICAGVGAVLLACLVLTAWSRRSFAVLFIGLGVFASAFTANSLLKFNQDTAPRLEETAFARQLAPGEEKGPQMYLFFSLHCGHCTTVLKNLGFQPSAWKVDWHLSCVDTGQEDLEKLAYALSRTKNDESVFLSLLRVKQSPEVPATSVPKELEKQAQQAKAYLKRMGFSGIPTLVALEGPGRKTVLNGAVNIARYLLEKGLIRGWVSE